jgi:hypothetical protein
MDDDENEDSYEVAPAILLHLLTKDDKKYPQENKKYFESKN